MSRSAAVIFVLVLALLAPDTEALKTRMHAKKKFWPFSMFFSTVTEAPKVATVTKPPRRSLKTVKASVMLSAPFQKKTALLCSQASEEEGPKCVELAQNRLFCKLLQRQGQRFEDLDGYADETTKCSTVDIMENPLDAAKDELLERDAAKA